MHIFNFIKMSSMKNNYLIQKEKLKIFQQIENFYILVCTLFICIVEKN